MKKINIIFTKRESRITSCFKVDGKALTLARYDKRTPGLLKVETTKYKMISLCSKMYCAAEATDIVIVVHVKILYVNVLLSVNVVLSFHAKEYKNQETI